MDLIRKFSRLEGGVASFYAAQCILTLEYLHSLDYIYRDLKPENLFIQSNGYLKIGDFGFVKKVTGKTYTVCGTPEYIAPEIIEGNGYDKSVDWYTLGMLIYEMTVGHCHFSGSTPMEVF